MAAMITGILADIASIIVLSGAIVVAVTAYFVLKSTLKKDVSQTREQPAQKAKAGDTAGQPGRNFLVAGIRKLLGRRAGKAAPGSDKALPVQPPAGEGPPALAPEVDLPPLPQDQEAPVAGPSGESPPALALEADLPPLPQDQEAPGAEPAVEEPEISAPETPPDESATSEPETSPEKPEEASESDDSDVQKQKPEGGDMFSLFTEVAVEESGASKLAETLEEVDVHGLLEDAQNFKNQLRGS